ncbi:MAG: DUF5362 family protein [Chitinophagaceae bacterium]|jgi:phosphoglycerol transferase MdoB-like AlkP superfamily enzyme|nr:DUF5362 family protein [Chitinophagaceae bacterium]
MENQSALFDDLQIDLQGRDYLKETAKWSKFLAILSFIGAGFMLLLSFFAGTLFSSMRYETGSIYRVPGMGVGLFFIYLIVAVLIFIPNLYRLKFANQCLSALDSNDQALLTSSFSNLKSFNKFYGIAMIVYLAICVLAFVIAILAAAMR